MYKSKILTSMLCIVFTMSMTNAQDLVETKVKPAEKVTKKMAQSSETIAGFIAISKDHSTLLKALIAADLVKTFSGSDEYTVFAPTNAAFDKLPDGILDKLLDTSGKEMLQGILKFHVVAGTLSSTDLLKAIEKGNGEATITTINGDTLVASKKDGKVYLTDKSGNMAQITAKDARQSNGVVHVIDTVVLPN